MSSRFPFEKMWSFQNIEHQIAMELTYFNWYQVVQESQKAFWTFANMLQKILYDPTEERLPIDIPKAERFLTLYFGNGKDETPRDRGLYALDIVQRDFGDQYAILCRGWKDELDPAGHHQMLMLFYNEMYPLLWELWHQIADQIESKGAGIPQKWLDEAYNIPSEEEVHDEIEKMVETEGLIRMEPWEERE